MRLWMGGDNLLFLRWLQFQFTSLQGASHCVDWLRLGGLEVGGYFDSPLFFMLWSWNPNLQCKSIVFPPPGVKVHWVPLHCLIGMHWWHCNACWLEEYRTLHGAFTLGPRWTFIGVSAWYPIPLLSRGYLAPQIHMATVGACSRVTCTAGDCLLVLGGPWLKLGQSGPYFWIWEWRSMANLSQSAQDFLSFTTKNSVLWETL